MKATKKVTKRTKSGMPGMISSDIVIPRVGDTVRIHPDVAHRWELRSGMKKGAYDAVKEVDGTVVQVDRAYGMCSVQWETGNDNWLPPRLHVMDLVTKRARDPLDELPEEVGEAIVRLIVAVDDEARVRHDECASERAVKKAGEAVGAAVAALSECLLKNGVPKMRRVAKVA